MHRAGGGADGARNGRATTRFERSARFWLHAYPRRWRRDRGDEVAGVLLELAGAGAGVTPPEGTRVLDRGIGARAAFDLVRHGWATRLREHPPLLRWIAYMAVDLRLPPRYRGWAADEIDGAFYAARHAWPSWALVAWMVSRGLAPWPFALVLAALALLPLLPFTGRRRASARERHLVALPGEPLVHGAYVAMGEPRRRRPASWAAPRVLTLDLVAIAAGVATLLLAPHAPTAAPVDRRSVALGVVALAGLVAALANRGARGALATRIGDLPVQPHRVVEVPGLRRRLALLANPAAIVGLAVVEILATRTALLSPLLALVAAIHLPRALAMATAARRVGYRAPDGSPLAWADLSTLAATRRPPRPDQPVRVVRRWDGPTVPGQAVLGPRVYTGEPGEPGGPFRLA